MHVAYSSDAMLVIQHSRRVNEGAALVRWVEFGVLGFGPVPDRLEGEHGVGLFDNHHAQHAVLQQSFTRADAAECSIGNEDTPRVQQASSLQQPQGEGNVGLELIAERLVPHGCRALLNFQGNHHACQHIAQIFELHEMLLGLLLHVRDMRASCKPQPIRQLLCIPTEPPSTGLIFADERATFHDGGAARIEPIHELTHMPPWVGRSVKGLWAKLGAGCWLRPNFTK